MTASPLDQLIGLLELEQIEENLFRAFHPPDRTHRLFGGQIVAQALMAGLHTVPADRPVHSLHAYFLRPGDPSVPAVIDVERIRDGRSFTTRRIVVIQKGEAIFNMDASFQVRETGLEHAFEMPPLAPPALDSLPPETRRGPFIAFRVDHERLSSDEPQPPAKSIWFRANGNVEANAAANMPGLHCALLAYESDSALLGTARLPHRGGYERRRMQMASLDHSIWFHADVDVGEWLLYTMESPAAGHGRGFNRGLIFQADGTLVASCMQEGLMRLWD